jgi:hypothetical protein
VRAHLRPPVPFGEEHHEDGRRLPLRRCAIQRRCRAGVCWGVPLPRLSKAYRQRFSFLIGVPKTTLNIQGALKTFASPGDTGKPVVRQFCTECGSSIGIEASNLPGVLIINGGTLDDPISIKPTAEIYCERALPWVQLEGMQRFAKLPV